MCVFQFYVFVTHQGPCSEVGSIEFESFSEIRHCFFVIGHETVVIPNDAARLWSELVDIVNCFSQVTEFGTSLEDEEHVGVDVDPVHTVRIQVHDFIEYVFSSLEILRIVSHRGAQCL